MLSMPRMVRLHVTWVLGLVFVPVPLLVMLSLITGQPVWSDALVTVITVLLIGIMLSFALHFLRAMAQGATAAERGVWRWSALFAGTACMPFTWWGGAIGAFIVLVAATTWARRSEERLPTGPDQPRHRAGVPGADRLVSMPRRVVVPGPIATGSGQPRGLFTGRSSQARAALQPRWLDLPDIGVRLRLTHDPGQWLLGPLPGVDPRLWLEETLTALYDDLRLTPAQPVARHLRSVLGTEAQRLTGEQLLFIGLSKTAEEITPVLLEIGTPEHLAGRHGMDPEAWLTLQDLSRQQIDTSRAGHVQIPNGARMTTFVGLANDELLVLTRALSQPGRVMWSATSTLTEDVKPRRQATDMVALFNSLAVVDPIPLRATRHQARTKDQARIRDQRLRSTRVRV